MFQSFGKNYDSKTGSSIAALIAQVYGDNMGPTWGQQEPGGPHAGPMNLAIWELSAACFLPVTEQGLRQLEKTFHM